MYWKRTIWNVMLPVPCSMLPGSFTFQILIVFPGSNISLWVRKGAKKQAAAKIGGILEDNFHNSG
jgi:hypothetical protein